MHMKVSAALTTFVISICFLIGSPREQVTPRPQHSARLPFEVEWRVSVGCGWAGFFVEVVLGFLPPLLELGVRVVLLCGRCEDTFLAALTDGQRAAYGAAWVS